MKKAATVLFWTSFGLDILYIMVILAGSLIGGSLNPTGSTDGVVYIIGIIYQLIRGGVPLVVKLIMMLIIIYGMKSEHEGIVAEIITIILFSGIATLFNNGLHMLLTNLMNNIGSDALVGFALMNNGANWGYVFHSISNTLLITATAFAIAYKKVEMVDIRRIQDEEDL